VHTRYSGHSLIYPHLLSKIAKRKGLDGVAITDHETMRGCRHLKSTPDFWVIQGVEKMTNLGSVIGLFISEDIVANDFFEVADAVHSQGGILILPHPFDIIRRDTFKAENLKKAIRQFDAIEVFNSRCLSNLFNKQARNMGNRLQMPMVAGSDAHFQCEIGNASTQFDCFNLEEIPSLIKKNNQSKWRTQGRLSSRFVHLPTLLARILPQKR